MAEHAKAFDKDGLPIVQVDRWGTKGHLTESQQRAYDEFRQQVKEDQLNIAKFKVESLESVSLRFLRARSFNVPNALQLLGECVHRKVEGRSEYWSQRTPDECAECDVEALKKWYPHANIGYDKFNRPVLFEHSGAVDGHAIYQMTTLEKLVRYHWYSMENHLNQMFENAPRPEGEEPVISTCVVIDLRGFNMHHTSSLVLDHVKAMVALDNACYPETLGKMIVINAPWLAVSAWDLVKGWLDPRTQQKIEIMKSGPEQELRLKQFISDDQLPVDFGGQAPPLYRRHKDLEFLHVNRYSAVRKFMALRQHQTLVVDTYVTEGADLHMEIFVSDRPFLRGEYPPTHDVIGYGDMSKFVQQNPGARSVLKREFRTQADRKPQRFVDEFVAAEGDVHYAVVYGNSARLVTRPLTYNLIVRDPAAHAQAASPSSIAASTVAGTVLTSVEHEIQKMTVEDRA